MNQCDAGIPTIDMQPTCDSNLMEQGIFVVIANADMKLEPSHNLNVFPSSFSENADVRRLPHNSEPANTFRSAKLRNSSNFHKG